jgi:hypothetical protein
MQEQDPAISRTSWLTLADRPPMAFIDLEL